MKTLTIQNLPSKVQTELWEALDENDEWRKLALGYPRNTQHRLEAFSSCENPSQNVLIYLSNHHGLTVNILVEKLEELRIEKPLLLLCKYDPAQILKQPLPLINVDEGDKNAVTLTCVAEGLPFPKYQWYRKRCGESEFVEMEGEQRSKLQILPVGLFFTANNDSGEYKCRVYNSPKSNNSVDFEIYDDDDHPKTVVDSEISRLQIVELPCLLHNDKNNLPEGPKIVWQPVAPADSINPGSSIELEVKAESQYPLKYQWYMDDKAIEGATNNVLKLESHTLMPLNETSKWIFQCAIENIKGSVLSKQVTIHLKPPADNQSFIAADKVALLIGNAYYDHLPSLWAPVEDVRTLGKMLTSMGFKVIALFNLNLEEMRTAVTLFKSMLDKRMYGFFYYAGHGCEFMNQCFMLPVESTIDYSVEDALSASHIESAMQKKEPALCVLVLDMCRKLPSNQKQNIPAIRQRDDSVVHRNTLRVYATTEGCSAFEEKNQPNGIFMKYLKNFIALDIPVRDVFNRVKQAVAGESQAGSLQFPWSGDNLAQNFKLTDTVFQDSDKNEIIFNKLNELVAKTVKFRLNEVWNRRNVCVELKVVRYLDIFQNGLTVELKVTEGSLLSTSPQSRSINAAAITAHLVTENTDVKVTEDCSKQFEGFSLTLVKVEHLQRLKSSLEFSVRLVLEDETCRLTKRVQLGYPLIGAIVSTISR